MATPLIMTRDGLMEVEAIEREDFRAQLQLHFERGTRPRLSADNLGLAWTVREMGIALMMRDGKHQQILEAQSGAARKDALDRLLNTKISEFRNWYAGRNLPMPLAYRQLALALFGDGPHEQQLEGAFRKAWCRDRDNPTKPVTYGLRILNEKTLETVHAFDETSYGFDKDGKPLDIGFDLFRGWWQVFPDGFLIAAEGRKPFAVTGLFPVTRAWAEDFVARRVEEEDLTPAIIAEALSDPDGRTWYFSGIASKGRSDRKGVRGHHPELIGMALLTWVRNLRSVPLDDEFLFVAEGTTEPGERLLADHFHFRLKSPGIGETKPRFSAYTTMREVQHLLRNKPSFARSEYLATQLKDEFWAAQSA